MVVVLFHSPGVVDASTSSQQAKDRLMMVSPTKTNGSNNTRALPGPNMVTGIKKYLGGMAVRAVAFHICTPAPFNVDSTSLSKMHYVISR